MSIPNLADLFEDVVDVVPERVAVVEGGVRLDFAALDRLANQFAWWLRDRDIGPGDRVGLALTNRALHLAALFGAFKVRAVPVNLNLRYTADELAQVLRNSGAVAIVAEESVSNVVADARPHVDALRACVSVEELSSQLREIRADRPDIHRSGDDHYLLYTGGTTGLPRGVLWRHEDFVAGALDGGGLADLHDPIDPDAHPDEQRRAALAARPASIMLPACPLSHGTAQWVTFRMLLTGSAVVLDPSPRLTPEHIWDLVDTEGVSRLTIVGDAIARPLLDALEAQPKRWSLDSLVLVASGGAVLSPGVRDALLRHLPGAALVDGFGSSESGGHGRLVVFPGQTIAAPDGLMRFEPDPTTAVLDEDLTPLPPGSPKIGRLARRAHIPLGYLDDPARSATTFPVVDGVRWAIPGDLATIGEDGSVTVLGRDASTINSGGEKVFAEQVEVVLRAHPAVLDAIVVGLPDPRWGSRVAAVVAVRPEWLGTLDAAHLDEHCREHLAGFKVPRTTVLTDEVRRSPSGKADLRWARATLQAQLG